MIQYVFIERERYIYIYIQMVLPPEPTFGNGLFLLGILKYLGNVFQTFIRRRATLNVHAALHFSI